MQNELRDNRYFWTLGILIFRELFYIRNSGDPLFVSLISLQSKVYSTLLDASIDTITIMRHIYTQISLRYLDFRSIRQEITLKPIYFMIIIPALLTFLRIIRICLVSCLYTHKTWWIKVLFVFEVKASIQYNIGHHHRNPFFKKHIIPRRNRAQTM